MMIFLMLTILMVQLQSFQKMFLVISVAPLGLIGVVGIAPNRHANRFCRDPPHYRAEQDDHPQFGDPDRPDRHGSRPGAASLGCGHRRDDAPLAGDRADRGRRLARDDPDHLGSLLGTDGLRDHLGLFVATLLTLLFLPALYVAWFRIKEPRKEPQPGLGAGLPAVAQ